MVNQWRGIFQEDLLSPILFVIATTPLAMYGQCNPDLPWSRKAVMPVLHPLQVWKAATLLLREEVSSLSQGKAAAAPMGLLVFMPPLEMA